MSTIKVKFSLTLAALAIMLIGMTPSVSATPAEAAQANIQCNGFSQWIASNYPFNTSSRYAYINQYDYTTHAQEAAYSWQGTHSYLPGSFCLKATIPANGSNYYLVFQSDGNLVFYTTTGVPQWSSSTYGRGARLMFQADRNIVIYDAQGQAVWAASNWWTIPRTVGMRPTSDWWTSFNAAPSQPNWYFGANTTPSAGQTFASGTLSIFPQYVVNGNQEYVRVKHTYVKPDASGTTGSGITAWEAIFSLPDNQRF